MTADSLFPSLDLLAEEYVLVQAWKKTASHIRRHNWYADTLALDRTSANLPRFLDHLRDRIRSSNSWITAPIRIVPAPKSQDWQYERGLRGWHPVEKARLRPLADVNLEDQVVATALMLCLADRVETIQGDPRQPITDPENRRKIVSYGNRLFCDKSGDQLYHRWGSGRLYRAYYQDYRSFLGRPAIVARSVEAPSGSRVIIVHSDLRQFYDRVRPTVLSEKLTSLLRAEDESNFFNFARTMLNWRWHRKDEKEVARYAKQTGLVDFSSVALPQGLVAAGFFANVVLLDFDKAVQDQIPAEIADGLRIEDACRYVDDFRIVLTANKRLLLQDAEASVVKWLDGLLSRLATGVEASKEKTRAALPDGDERPLVRQSRKMSRIQRAISGGFDAVGGEEILSSLQGLMRAQQRYSEKEVQEEGWALAPVADVRDTTIARFAAARFRSTYRSLRPLLMVEVENCGGRDKEVDGTSWPRSGRTQRELDNDVKAFALGLVENWVNDPSNVRLLRIGLDLWPDRRVLEDVLGLLRPFTDKGGRRGEQRRVAWYCLAEVLRAGATETGIVEVDEAMPGEVDFAGYRVALTDEAARLVALPTSMLPWYLRQQALLCLAVHAPSKPLIARPGRSPESRHYRELIRFLRGDPIKAKGTELATLAILAQRAFGPDRKIIQQIADQLSAQTLEEVAVRDPELAVEILKECSTQRSRLSPRVRDDLCLREPRRSDEWHTLADLVLSQGKRGRFRNEPELLKLAIELLRQIEPFQEGAITPNEVEIKFGVDDERRYEIRIIPSKVSEKGSLYASPTWCDQGQAWRFRLGYLLRFVLTGNRDYTRRDLGGNWESRKAAYRAPRSHWLQRRYAMFNGLAGFEEDWLPISDWVEGFLSALLQWPGCHKSCASTWVEKGIQTTIEKLESRLKVLSDMCGSSAISLLPLETPNPVPNPESQERPLRACIAQTVIPDEDDFQGSDLTLSGDVQRRRHRNHLSTALAAVEKMLNLRETHLDRKGRLDWLILPELSVHPRDVRTHLVPFARAHRCMVLAGLTYEELLPGEPLVNSALWVIPRISPEGGLETITRRQGKRNLAPLEKQLQGSPHQIQGFRPCQWIVGYEWSKNADPLRLTCTVCYDATDLGLMAVLRNRSDVLAIPALNRDIGTFDHMALALHYHMYQLVIVANNGKYGGSNAYMPRKEEYRRQVFHLHGQPQASIAFLEIDDIGGFLKRKSHACAAPTSKQETPPLVPWKYPPAGIE